MGTCKNDFCASYLLLLFSRLTSVSKITYTRSLGIFEIWLIIILTFVVQEAQQIRKREKETEKMPQGQIGPLACLQFGGPRYKRKRYENDTKTKKKRFQHPGAFPGHEMGLNGTWPGIAKTEKNGKKMVGLGSTKMVQILVIFFHFQGDRFHIVFKVFGHPMKTEKKWKKRFQKQLSMNTYAS